MIVGEVRAAKMYKLKSSVIKSKLDSVESEDVTSFYRKMKRSVQNVELVKGTLKTRFVSIFLLNYMEYCKIQRNNFLKHDKAILAMLFQHLDKTYRDIVV